MLMKTFYKAVKAKVESNAKPTTTTNSEGATTKPDPEEEWQTGRVPETRFLVTLRDKWETNVRDLWMPAPVEENPFADYPDDYQVGDMRGAGRGAGEDDMGTGEDDDGDGDNEA